MMKHVVLLAICGLSFAQDSEPTSWERDMQSGKLPEMTLQQQMQLFGAKIAVSATPPLGPPPPPPPPAPTTTQPWWRSIETGQLPSMTPHQKIILFGSTNVEQDSASSWNDKYPEYSEEHFGKRSQRSVSGSLQVENNTRLLKGKSAETVEEGRGRLKKILVPVLLAMTIVAAIVLPALMTVIKLIAVKGLWSGVVSLIITKLLGLKALLSHHHHHDDHASPGRRPYFVYLPHGKHRREEEESQQDYQPYDGQWGQGDWEQWRRDGANAKV